jgi:putative transposon-encoded protein
MNTKQSATIESTNSSLDESNSSAAGSTRSRDAVSAEAVDRLYTALRVVDSISERTPARDELWIVLWETVTTRSEAWVTPIGSNARVRVTKDDADAELIAAWEWLMANEDSASGRPGRAVSSSSWRSNQIAPRIGSVGQR